MRLFVRSVFALLLFAQAARAATPEETPEECRDTVTLARRLQLSCNPPVVSRDGVSAPLTHGRNAYGMNLYAARSRVEVSLELCGAFGELPAVTEFTLAVLNLASALNLAGHPDQAMAALSSHFARSIVRIYIAVHEDPELMPLLNTPGFAALLATPPGTAARSVGLQKRRDRCSQRSSRS